MRRNVFKTASQHGDKTLQELVMLHAKVAELESRVTILRALLGDRESRPHTTLRQRLAIICHIELFDIPKRRITEYFGIARSTFDRWRRDALGKITARKEPANKTPVHLAAFVWDMFSKNPWWGKVRQSQQLALLGIFLSPSTVRNILRRPKPTGGSERAREQPEPTRSTPKAGIEAKHPNHVWSADLTTYKIWGLWPVHILVIIDHFSRKLLAAAPLTRPTTECVRNAFKDAIARYKPPTHCVTDQGVVFTASIFTDFLKQHATTHHLGAVGVKASVAITERVIETLKYEWLRRVPLICGRDHLNRLCSDFATWYGALRPHQGLGGNRPDDIFCGIRRAPIALMDRERSKSLPPFILRVDFPEPNTTAWHLGRVS